jgi:ribosomal protein L4
MLSAKLYEDRIVLIDSDMIEFGKTKFLFNVLKPYMNDHLTFLTSFEPSQNFMSACGNLRNVQVFNPYEFNTPHLLKSDLIFMTKEGLT